MPAMPGMTGLALTANPFADHDTSGTDAQPASTPEPMLMSHWRNWTLMLHGLGFANYTAETSRRGAERWFSTNWAMGMAQRRLGPGVLTLRVMLSLEPLTITGRRYPELFQTGETAFGRPLVDAQHPHNFFMELAAIYDLPLGHDGLLTFYAAPMGDPAIGPEAFPHRASDSQDPIAPLGHHLEDSTHIAADVATVGLSYRAFRLEASGFHGREPGENRWAIQTGAMDSFAARATVAPGGDWTGQYSLARITSPEALFPGVNQIRMTASLQYHRPLARGDWANSLVWGRTRDTPGDEILNGYLLESTLGFADRNHVWTRIENVDKTNLLLLGENPLPAGFEERFLGRVQAFSFGYDRELTSGRLSAALGAQGTLDATPPAAVAIYGAHPAGLVLFLRLRLGEDGAGSAPDDFGARAPARTRAPDDARGAETRALSAALFSAAR